MFGFSCHVFGLLFNYLALLYLDYEEGYSRNVTH